MLLIVFVLNCRSIKNFREGLPEFCERAGIRQLSHKILGFFRKIPKEPVQRVIINDEDKLFKPIRIYENPGSLSRKSGFLANK